MASITYTKLVSRTREVFMTGRTKTMAWRKSQLMAMLRLLDEKRDTICKAVYADLRKHKNEADIAEVDFIRNDLVDTINNLEEWTKPEKVGRNLMTLTDEAFIKREPFGVALILGAWNYPIQLTLGPMIGAIAAGNCVILKPSEVTEKTAELLAELVPQYFDKECITVVNGGVPETTALLSERFDFIFYTGNSQVAKIVAAAAAKNLTPVLLELGGKSPCYIHPDSDIDLASRRLLWGKFMNAGQTCIAPDYVLCTKDVEAKLLTALKSNIRKFWGEDPQKSDSMSRIVNNRHFNRVKALMNSGEIVIGGQTDEKDNYIAPTVVVNVKPTDPVMEQEIFGPVLPIMTVKDETDAITFINSREKPLALYVFSNNKAIVSRFLDQTSSGGVTANDTIMHCSLNTLPFGGVGNSGQGGYHGKFTVEAFSHKRSCLLKGQKMEKINDVRYPPYTETKAKFANFVLRKNVKRSGVFGFWPIVIIGAIIGFMAKFFKTKM